MITSSARHLRAKRMQHKLSRTILFLLAARPGYGCRDVAIDSSIRPSTAFAVDFDDDTCLDLSSHSE